ncbi:unnamed protein product [Angiostrongylus costaricensis]|uniref:Reverse transcriptase domain-containing protein n=1 Tax=Angiostrongylus costaricensis TaxID=334426 RepID=A0A0R3PTW3_ANGCS|nr:unnamed protein product [Angiostrongylus costaricensis]
MRTLEWDNMGVKIDGRQLHHLRFADDIVLITPNISQAQHMLHNFDKACGKICLQLNLTKMMFMKNGLVSHAPFTLNGTYISECSSNIYLGREINMMNDLALEQKKTSGLESFQEHRECSEENKEHPIPCPPFLLNGTSCSNVCVRNVIAA